MSIRFSRAVLPGGLFLAGSVCFGQGVTNTFTSSAAQVDVIHDTPVTQQVNTYSLELRARMQGGGLLFDQFFNVPLNDPAVQNAITRPSRADGGGRRFLHRSGAGQ